jgi:hypothetical protein
MKRLIAGIYRVLFQLTGSKTFSLGFALVYLTTLNLCLIYGLCILLKDVLPTSAVLQLFSFPYIVISSAAMFGLNLMLAPSNNSLALAEKRRKTNYSSLIIYSAASMLLLAYTMLFNRLF